MTNQTTPDNQVQPATFGSLAELEKHLQEPVAQEAEAPVLNSYNSQGATPTLTATTAQPTQDTPEPVQPVIEVAPREIPPLEAKVEEDAKRAKEDGSFEELKNAVLGVMRELSSERNATKPVAKRVQDILEHASFDPNNIMLSKDGESNPLVVHSQLEILESTKPNIVFPVIALKSGYKLDLSALTNNEKINIRNLRGSMIDQTMKILRIIHGKITDTSVGRISFDRFLDVTAEADYDTILYAIFCATFPDATEYTINCPHCKAENKLNLFPDHLIEVIDIERAGTYVREVLEGYNRGEEFLTKSLVATPNRIILPKSKMVLELKTPTLRMLLSTMQLADRTKAYNDEIVAATKYIGGLFVPDIEQLARGNAVFHPINDINQRLSVINGLASEDLKALRDGISDRVRKYHVEYRIPDFSCASATCGKEIRNVSVDLMELIFLGIGGEL